MSSRKIAEILLSASMKCRHPSEAKILRFLAKTIAPKAKLKYRPGRPSSLIRSVKSKLKGGAKALAEMIEETLRGDGE
jgi:hypothetical protein